MTIEIYNRWSRVVVFTHAVDGATMAEALAAARANDAALRGADLRETDLRGADLSGDPLRDPTMYYAELTSVDLRDANLSGVNLSGADLSGADLSGANLDGANLSDANLRGADLSDANLSNADLSRADLRSADVCGAILRGARLGGANLLPIRDDLWAVLSSAPREVPALIAALKAGRVDGSTYADRATGLLGTIAAARRVPIGELGTLKPDCMRPAECFFMGIVLGGTPENNQFSALALEWTSQWLGTMRAAFAPSA
ncbi:pentapeptide repeat-containing protein [Massilia mucilaginosa]|nr:pentapeptide repeat-containing protein [Massilia mucilaginosa]